MIPWCAGTTSSGLFPIRGELFVLVETAGWDAGGTATAQEDGYVDTGSAWAQDVVLLLLAAIIANEGNR